MRMMLQLLWYIVATVTLSIGQGTTHDETAAISAVSGAGPWTVTIAANSSVNGDALWDEHATPRKYLITAGGGTTTLTVADHEGIGGEPDNSGTTPSEIKRYYNGSDPLTDWEVDLEDTNVYGTDAAVGECYNDAVFDLSLVINGGATPGLTSITLTVASGERHNGTEDNGARFVQTGNKTLSTSGSIGKTIEWLEFDANASFSTVRDVSNSTNTSTTFRNLLVHGAANSSNASIVGVTMGTKGSVLNTIIYDVAHSASGNKSATGLVASTNKGVSIFNVTIHNISNTNGGTGSSIAIVLGDFSSASYRNIIATDSSGDASGTIQDYSLTAPVNPTIDHNLASDDTDFGTGSIGANDGVVTANQFVNIASGFEDLRLKQGADAINAGIDLGTAPAGVQFDIRNYNRDTDSDGRAATWDMGAHEAEIFSTDLFANSLLINQAVQRAATI